MGCSYSATVSMTSEENIVEIGFLIKIINLFNLDP